MVDEVKKLESPIDVMFLIHKALSAEALHVEKIIQNYEPGESLQSFRAAFNEWAVALMYHADVEDQYMTLPMLGFQPARDNEAEHVELLSLGNDLVALMDAGNTTGLKERVKKALVVLTEEQHNELMERLQDVVDVLGSEIGRQTVISRTKRHLYGKVVALRISQDDHLENEEAFVLTEVREQFSASQELDLARRLLIDGAAEDSDWVLRWMEQHLTPVENQLLQELVSKCRQMPAAAD